MPGTNKSNPGTTESNQQETNNPETRGSVGPANSITNAIQNGDVHGARTETVYLARSTGTQVSILARDLLTALETQNPIYSFPLTSTSYVVVPRHIDVWAGGNVILTAKFNECSALSATTAPMSQQFYAVGFDGADRCHIQYKWGMPAEVRPWLADSTAPAPQAPCIIECSSPFDTEAPTTWFAKFTFTVFDRTFFNVVPTLFMDKTPQEMEKQQQEQRGIKRLKRMKDLTLPNNME